MWYHVLQSLAERNLFSLFCIDEAHSINQDGRAFRVQFNDAVKSIQNLHSIQRQKVPRLIMSATMSADDQKRVSTLLGGAKPQVLRGDLSRRETQFSVSISGRASNSLYRSAARDLENYPQAQQIWYCNSATSAEESMVPKADQLLQKYSHPSGKLSVAMSFTGSDGLMLKTVLMEAFTKYDVLNGGPIIHDDGTVSLPCIGILCGTNSVNAGVSSNFVKFAKHKDIPRNLYDLVQELGRVNRLLRDIGCSFEVHLDFNSSLRLFLSCMSNQDASERNVTWKMALDVLRCLVIPTMCYHQFIEAHFGSNSDAGPCINHCSKCLGDCAQFTGLIYRRRLQSLLTITFLSGKEISGAGLLTKLKKSKAEFFHEDHIPGDHDAAPIHALALQLVAAGILEFDLNDKSKAGTKKLSEKNAILKLGITDDGDGNEMPAFMLDSSWIGITTV
jgi:superfamily II DNA helicase RecQ